MKLLQEFNVAGAPGRVWDVFQDVPRIARCLPGTELTESDGDEHSGIVKVKLGPMTTSFEGRAAVEINAAEKTGRIVGSGVDRRAGSRGRVDLTYRVEPDGDGTKVSLDTDLTLTGTAAQFGRQGIINEIARRMIEEFVVCLEALLAAPDADTADTIRAGEIKGFRLVITGIWRTLIGAFKRLLHRGDPG